MTSITKPGRPIEFTSDRKSLALAELRRTGRTRAAARAAGMCPSTMDRARKIDPEGFGAAWADARAEFVESLEEDARLMAKGQLAVERFYDADGVLTHEVYSKPSAAVMIALLKGNAREKYGDQFKGEVHNTGGIDHTHRIDPSQLSLGQLRSMRELLGEGPVLEVELVDSVDSPEGGSE